MSSHPFKVKALFEYISPHEDDLKFPEGQIITVTEDDEDDWYTGEYVDSSGAKQEGIFPRNFVERYEPVAPPRPTRAPRPKKDTEAAAFAKASEPSPQAPVVKEVPQEPLPAETQNRKANVDTPEPPQMISEMPTPTVSRPAEPSPAPVPAAPKPVISSKPSAPPVSEKPSSGSFRDRIAAFNKSAAPPPAPFKPGGLSSGSSNFIKKPFVAPPPSKDAYIPPPREPVPQKVYRRDEDPEIAAKEAEIVELAEKAGLSPTTNEGEGEDRPKPTSLKERIALLQKQQMEQAARHAEAAQKKEKPKRPPKKRTDSHNVDEEQEGEEPVLERQDSHATVGRKSMESQHEPSAARPITRRKSSRGATAAPSLPRETFGDGNEADMSGAGDETEETEEASTGRDEADERPKARAAAHTSFPSVGEEEGDEEVNEDEHGEEEEEEEEEEEDDIDPEVRRKEELRARMAKMSGGMGMYGMFGRGMPMPGPALPSRKKPSSVSEKKQTSEFIHEDFNALEAHAPPVPAIPLPGMTKVKSREGAEKKLEVEREDDEYPSPITESRPAHDAVDAEDIKPASPMRTKSDRPQAPGRNSYAAPPVPGSRPAPPPVPTESRPPPPPRPLAPMSPSAGSESDDEMSLHGEKPLVDTSATDASNRAVPPRPVAPPPPSRPGEGPTSPRLSTSRRASYLASETNEPYPASPTTTGTSSKRASRVPPIPVSSPPGSSIQTRAPPPPPPTAPLSRSSTGDDRVLPSPKHAEQEDSEEEITEYEGDYDTDIASAAPHKDALKSSAAESSLDDNTPIRSTVGSPSGAPPPLPPLGPPHRAMPPPLPSQPPPNSRQSADMPRAAPPPPPPPKEQYYDQEDEEYDPYRYTATKQSAPVSHVAPSNLEEDEEDIYGTSPPRSQPPPPQPQQDRAAPPPPPRDQAPPSAPRTAPRQSIDSHRTPIASRRSTDLNRISMESGHMANDVDLGQGTLWWTQPNGVPPVFQNRKDILHESEESTTTKRGGKSITTKDLYVLFQDYSQTIISIRFDPSNPADAILEQRHDAPPSRLRQDQLEASYERFGRKVAEAVASKKDTVVGDGTPQGLITELLKPFSEVLLPIGTRAYGALVYSNLANASTSQYDEIRPGDIITLRNAKLQGKHGPMHAKYSTEVGGNGIGHVGVVAEWDGTKKKVRAWEQGREKKKVGLESYKLDDLRSGEVKIWRVMDRGWVGWEGSN